MIQHPNDLTQAGSDRQDFSFSENSRRSKASSDQVFNEKFERVPLDVKPGEFHFLDDAHNMIVATVGAGVVVTAYDDKLHFGILAYVVLPQSVLQAFPKLSSVPQEDLDRAIAPIEGAIAEMKRHGAGKGRVRFRLFGGSDFSEENERGMKTGIFVKEYLSRKGLSVMGEDLGGKLARRIHFLPDNGTVTRFFLKRQSDYDFIEAIEGDFMNS